MKVILNLFLSLVVAIFIYFSFLNLIFYVIGIGLTKTQILIISLIMTNLELIFLSKQKGWIK